MLREVPLALAQPFQSSAGSVAERRVLLLTLGTDGLEGWSECVAPGTPHYTYETTETSWHVLTEHLLPHVVGSTLEGPRAIQDRMAHVRGHPMAKAAVDMAVWDLFARAGGLSLSQLVGGTRSAVPAGVSLGMMQTERLLDVVEAYVSAGYGRVKVKIGPGRDVTVLRALRARFPDLALWADANSAYSLDDAALFAELDTLGLGMLEEPVASGAFVECARLQERIATPICLDESIGSTADAVTALELGSCRIVNLKPGRVGGFGPALDIYQLLEAADVPLWCGGMLETGIGRAHNLALASLPRFELPGDISASRRYWEHDVVTPEHDVVDGEMAVPTAPGIGVEIDVERIEALTERVFELG